MKGKSTASTILVVLCALLTLVKSDLKDKSFFDQNYTAMKSILTNDSQTYTAIVQLIQTHSATDTDILNICQLLLNVSNTCVAFETMKKWRVESELGVFANMKMHFVQGKLQSSCTKNINTMVQFLNIHFGTSDNNDMMVAKANETLAEIQNYNNEERNSSFAQNNNTVTPPLSASNASSNASSNQTKNESTQRTINSTTMEQKLKEAAKGQDWDEPLESQKKNEPQVSSSVAFDLKLLPVLPKLPSNISLNNPSNTTFNQSLNTTQSKASNITSNNTSNTTSNTTPNTSLNTPTNQTQPTAQKQTDDDNEPSNASQPSPVLPIASSNNTSNPLNPSQPTTPNITNPPNLVSSHFLTAEEAKIILNPSTNTSFPPPQLPLQTSNPQLDEVIKNLVEEQVKVALATMSQSNNNQKQPPINITPIQNNLSSIVHPSTSVSSDQDNQLTTDSGVMFTNAIGLVIILISMC